MRRSFVRAGSLFREPFLTAKDRPVGRFTGHIHSPSGLRYKVQSGVLFFHGCHESSASSGERDSKGSSYSLCPRFPRSIDRSNRIAESSLFHASITRREYFYDWRAAFESAHSLANMFADSFREQCHPARLECQIGAYIVYR